MALATLPGQELEAPRYNHPCRDLLDSERRGEYINICVPLYRASIKGDLEAVRVILEGRQYLVRYSITEKKETPLHVAALANYNSKFVRYLVAAIAGKHRMAMIMLEKNHQLLTIRGSGNMMPLYLAAYHGQYDTVVYLYNHSQRMSSDGWTDDDRNSVFLKCIEIDCFKNGNANFLVELIREYPDLILKTNDDGQTIFHIGLSYHHQSIFNLLLGIGDLKDTIAQLKDKDGNTLLHSVSKNNGRNPHEHGRGTSFQLQREFLWFMRVEAMVPLSYEQAKNAADQTPGEAFTHNHRDLIFKANKWRKETSNQCMVVATLITTISFSAAFTIPGGFNQDTGFPMFLRNKAFTAFVIFDGISFILSSVSILIFLSLSFARNPDEQHTKFVLGFLVLLLSIITLMAAFSASFFVLYHNDLLPIIMTSLATLPVIIFFLMQAYLRKMDGLIIAEYASRSKKLMLYN